MKITKAWLKEKQACKEGKAWLNAQDKTGAMDVLKSPIEQGLGAHAMSFEQVAAERLGLINRCKELEYLNSLRTKQQEFMQVECNDQRKKIAALENENRELREALDKIRRISPNGK